MAHTVEDGACLVPERKSHVRVSGCPCMLVWCTVGLCPSRHYLAKLVRRGNRFYFSRGGGHGDGSTAACGVKGMGSAVSAETSPGGRTNVSITSWNLCSSRGWRDRSRRLGKGTLARQGHRDTRGTRGTNSDTRAHPHPHTSIHTHTYIQALTRAHGYPTKC